MALDPVTVEVVVDDPWDFTDAQGSNVLNAQVRRTATSANHEPRFPLLIEFSDPITASAAEGTRFFVADTPASGRMDYARLTAGQVVMCQLTGLSDTQASGELSLDVSDWRGRFPAAGAQLKRAWPSRGSGGEAAVERSDSGRIDHTRRGKSASGDGVP